MVVNKSCVRHSQHYACVLVVKHVYYFLEKKTTSLLSTKILGVFHLELFPLSQFILPALPKELFWHFTDEFF